MFGVSRVGMGIGESGGKLIFKSHLPLPRSEECQASQTLKLREKWAASLSSRDFDLEDGLVGRRDMGDDLGRLADALKSKFRRPWLCAWLGGGADLTEQLELLGWSPAHSVAGPNKYPPNDLHDPLSFPLHGQLMLPSISTSLIFLLSLSSHFCDTSAQDPSTPRYATICPTNCPCSRFF